MVIIAFVILFPVLLVLINYLIKENSWRKGKKVRIPIKTKTQKACLNFLQRLQHFPPPSHFLETFNSPDDSNFNGLFFSSSSKKNIYNSTAQSLWQSVGVQLFIFLTVIIFYCENHAKISQRKINAKRKMRGLRKLKILQSTAAY